MSHVSGRDWALALFVAAVSGLCMPSAVRADCPAIGPEPATIVGVEDRLELRLADGRHLRLVGLDPALPTPTDPDRGEAARTRLAARAMGGAVTVLAMSNSPDRWGRISAYVFIAPSNPGASIEPKSPAGLAGWAVSQGLGRYLAEPAAHECRAALLSAESAARAAARGLWTDPYYGVLAVSDRAAFVERAGTNVVAEGELSAVQPGRFRTMLRFTVPRGGTSHRDGPSEGTFGGHLLSAAILPHTMKIFEKSHVDLASLIGRRLRLRGLLDLRFGPRIELAGPDDFEVLDAPVPPPAAGPP